MSKSDFEKRYSIAAKLGEGGMGEVFRVHDATLGRDVAMKCLNARTARSKRGRRRFYAEAQIMGELSHPGVVPVFDAGIDDTGRDYYLMKEVKGRTLRAVLTEVNAAGKPDFDTMTTLIDTFVRVCQTVAYAHSKGIVHRDIKPGNIMVDDFGVVYLLDWGIAKRSGEVESSGEDITVLDDEKTAAGAVLGTPGYMAPEQAFGHTNRATARTDVFALGLTLYEILTGDKAYKRRSKDESVAARFAHPPSPPMAVNPAVPRALSAICDKAIAQMPSERYANAGQLLGDLQAFREFRPVSISPPRWFERIGLWAHRKPRNAGLAMGIVLTVLILFTAASNTLLELYARAESGARVDMMLMGVEHDIELLKQRVVQDPTSRTARMRLAVEREAYIRALIASSALGHQPFSDDFMARYRSQSLALLVDLHVLGQVLQTSIWADKLLAQHERLGVFTDEDLVKLRRYQRAAQG